MLQTKIKSIILGLSLILLVSSTFGLDDAKEKLDIPTNESDEREDNIDFDKKRSKLLDDLDDDERYEDLEITWDSSDSDILKIEGDNWVIQRPIYETQEVTLEAILQMEWEEDETKEIPITIGVSEQESDLKNAKDSLDIDTDLDDDLDLDDLEPTVVTQTVYIHMNDGERVTLANIVEYDFEEYAQFEDVTGDQFIFPPNSFKLIHMTINSDESENQEEQGHEWAV